MSNFVFTITFTITMNQYYYHLGMYRIRISVSGKIPLSGSIQFTRYLPDNISVFEISETGVKTLE